jgi:predicted nucleic acid-binding protein
MLLIGGFRPRNRVIASTAIWQRAFDAQRELARTGGQRAVGIADLLTAVLACAHRLVHHRGHR